MPGHFLVGGPALLVSGADGSLKPEDKATRRFGDYDLLHEVADRCAVPCIARIPVGHIADQWTLPFGRTAVLDADSRTLTIE